MKIAIIALITALSPFTAKASQEYYCQKNALSYLVHIVNAPYVGLQEPVTENDFQLVSRKSVGDGSEAYEVFTFSYSSNQVYVLKLYVEGIGVDDQNICPLEKFSSSTK